MSEIFRGSSGKSLLYIFIAILIGYVLKITQAGEGYSDFGKGLQEGLSSVLSPKINPTFSFVPEIGLKFNLGFGGILADNTQYGQTQNPSYVNAATAFAQNNQQIQVSTGSGGWIPNS